MTLPQSCDTDLTDREWEQLKLLVLWGNRAADRRYTVDVKSEWHLLNLRSGRAWKLLRHDPPPWRTVYRYFGYGGRNGHADNSRQFQTVSDIRPKRPKSSRTNPEPSGALVDS
jgi:transposase